MTSVKLWWLNIEFISLEVVMTHKAAEPAEWPIAIVLWVWRLCIWTKFAIAAPHSAVAGSFKKTREIVHYLDWCEKNKRQIELTYDYIWELPSLQSVCISNGTVSMTHPVDWPNFPNTEGWGFDSLVYEELLDNWFPLLFIYQNSSYTNMNNSKWGKRR